MFVTYFHNVFYNNAVFFVTLDDVRADHCKDIDVRLGFKIMLDVVFVLHVHTYGA